MVAHQAFGCCVDGVEDGEFCDAGGTWGDLDGEYIGGEGWGCVPDPSSLAVADSFLNSLAAEPAAASTTCGAIAAAVVGGRASANVVDELSIKLEKNYQPVV